MTMHTTTGRDTVPSATTTPEAAGLGDGPPPADAASEGWSTAGGAGMAAENAPAGFTADVAGGPVSTDDPDEARRLVVDAAKAGPRTDAEQTEAEQRRDDRTDAEQTEAEQRSDDQGDAEPT